MFPLPSHADLKLKRMRHAFRSSEVLSALLAATLLWPLSVIVAAASTAAIGLLASGNVRAALLGTVATAVLAVVGLVSWFALDEFFCSAGRIVSFVSGILFVSLFQLYSHQLREMNAHPSMQHTFIASFSLSFSFLFFVHFIRVWLLTKEERAVVARSGPKVSLRTRLNQAVPRRGGIKQRRSRSIAIYAILIVSKMIHGTSLYILTFLLGTFLFVMGLAILSIVYAFYDRSRIGELDWLLMAQAVALLVVLSALAFLLTRVAMALKQLARRLSRHSLVRTDDNDRRPPVLFLRSFEDDQVTLPRPPLYLTYWLAEPTPRRLDHALIERFGHLCRFMALGKPGATDLPFGADRLFVPDDAWKATVEQLATRARDVVIVVDESNGVGWEVERMLQAPFVEKTLFLASPKFHRGLEAHRLLGSLLLAANVQLFNGYHIVAAFRRSKGWEILSSNTQTADDYVISCKAFLNRCTKAAPSG